MIYQSISECFLISHPAVYRIRVSSAPQRKTLAAMNAPVSARIEQIILRYRWLKRSRVDERMVAVNIAGFRALAGTP